jgi:hypothetical protein
MSYWIPTLILALVVLVLILQLPWSRPGAGDQTLPKKRNLGIPDSTDTHSSAANEGSHKSAAS